MAEKRTETPVHTVSLQFTGPLAEAMANHFFTDWLDGGLDQIWEERLDDADIAESITYDWDSTTRTLVIEAVADDDGEEEEEEEGAASDDADADEDEDEDEDEDAAGAVEGNPSKADA